MLITNQHPKNKSITVSVLGVPNAGKSTLINTLLGMDLSIVSSRPQTTRNKIRCVVTIDHTEIILTDTPGLHESSLELNKRLNQEAREGAQSADLNLILVDLTKECLPQISCIKKVSDSEFTKSWLVFTKADAIEDVSLSVLQEIFDAAKTIIPSLEKFFVISSKNGDNIHLLTGALCDSANPGPHLYPDGDLSDKPERFFVMEYIREQIFLLLKDELPYEIAVVIDEYKDLYEDNALGNSKTVAHISASILVNRPSQRAIVVGSQGLMIREIGTRARERIEALLDGQVHLNLHVKVSPKWFKNNYVLEDIGLPRAPDSHRVWRKKN